MILRSVLKGILGAFALLGFYFLVLSLVSGWNFTISQFNDNWYWVLGLSFGFGIQISIFIYLRALHREQASKKVVAASGATSTIAMLACCSHYLVSVLPIIGISGLAIIISQYQTEIFIVAVISNLLGIAYMSNKLWATIKQF